MKRGRNQRRRQGVNINRALDSNGPDVRIRGTANQIYDKYQALARDASSAGDRVKAENYLQHAEHYFRLMRSIQPSMPAPGEHLDADGDQPMVSEHAARRRESEAPSHGRDEEGDPEGAEVVSNGAAESHERRGEGEHEARRMRRRRPQRRPSGGEDDSERDEPAPADIAAS
jgi:hypothetical protein